MSTSKPLLDRKGRVYEPAVGPKLKKLLVAIFAIVALLGANSVYLIAIRLMGGDYQNWFYPWMFLLHLMLGLGLILPFLIFAARHISTAWDRPNRRAVRFGLTLFAVCLILTITGLALCRFIVDLKDPSVRSAVRWAHGIAPLVAIGLYVAHRLAGPKIKWRWSFAWGGTVVAFTVAMAVLHHEDPRQWHERRSAEGLKYFHPSEARTKTGAFISQELLMFDCQRCHQDVFDGWFHSAHHFSSFNNQPYLFSVSETREVGLKRDGNVKASRWCAGCHDPVPLFTGAFDDPIFDTPDFNTHPTAMAGITCAVCHSMTEITSTIGNASYIIEEPVMYPFATSENPVLRWVHDTLVKANPTLHKNTFLKPFHRKRELGDSYEMPRQAEFCSTCHKVSLPFAVNHYKEWLRGQNHYDAYLLSGVSGHGARSFYYPPDVAKVSCAECHMPLKESTDFGARDFDNTGRLKVHDHLFLAANTGIAFLNQAAALREGDEAAAQGFERTIEAHEKFLQENKLRIDVFGIKEGGTTEGKLHAPIRPQVPVLEPGKDYLIEVVVRTVGMGHLFTQGTVDSNEVWVDMEARSGDQIIGRSGAIDEKGEVDPWSHFVNVLVLDRHGNRIDRRNPQDIFVPLYNHQIPPGAAQVVHYRLSVPSDVSHPVRLTVRLNYRKFDYKYMEYVFNNTKSNPEGEPIPYLPVVVMCEDAVTLPVAGSSRDVENPPSPIKDEWQRWNDYGIACLLEQGGGSERGELRQAEEAFRKVVDLGQADGWANLARVYLQEGRVAEAVEVLQQAIKNQYKYPWVVAWLSAQADLQNGNIDQAIENFEEVLKTKIPERRFDFSLDYVVRGQLGQALIDRANQERGPARKAQREYWLRRAETEFQRALDVDSENLTAHYNLALIYRRLDDPEKADRHQRLYEKYKPDFNAQDEAIAKHRLRNPAADHAAQAVVIYDLHRPGAPGLAIR